MLKNIVLRVEGENAATALGEFKRFTALDRLLPTHLILVVFGEVTDDDWNGQRDDQHSTDTTRRTDQLHDNEVY